MKWGGWTNPRLRRWMGASFLLLLAGIVVQSVGGRQLTVLALLIEIAAAVVMVIGTYRHQEPPRQ